MISALASVVFASVGVARQKGKNASAVAYLRNIQSALEFFLSDIGTYPRCLPTCTIPPYTSASYPSLTGVLPGSYIRLDSASPMPWTEAYYVSMGPISYIMIFTPVDSTLIGKGTCYSPGYSTYQASYYCVQSP